MRWFFLGDVAKDLVGKSSDTLVAENCTIFSGLPAKITALLGEAMLLMSVCLGIRSVAMRFVLRC